MTRADITRRRLLDQARLAFAERGHDGVSVQRDILGPAGVSNGSFYHQFTDKTDLLVAVLEDAAEAGREVVIGAVGAGGDELEHDIARRGFEAWLELVDSTEELFRIQMRERQNPDPRVRSLIIEFRERWTTTLSAFLRARGVADADRAARLIAMLAMGVLMDYLDTPPADRPGLRAELVRSLPTFVAGGAAALSTEDTTA